MILHLKMMTPKEKNPHVNQQDSFYKFSSELGLVVKEVGLGLMLHKESIDEDDDMEAWREATL